MDADKLNSMFDAAKEAGAKWREQAKEDLSFYGLDHWDAATKQALIDEKRPPLVIPKIKPIVDYLSGWQRQNRYDMIFKPRKGSKAIEADVLTQLVKQILDLSNADYEISEWFFYGMTCGRAWITGEVDYTDDDKLGDLRLECPDPLSIYPDPNGTKYDGSDMQFIVRLQRVRFEDLKAAFGEKVEGLYEADLDDDDITYHHTAKNDQYKAPKSYGEKVAAYESAAVRVKETWYKESRPVVKLLDQTNPMAGPMEVPDNPAFIRDITTARPGMTVIEASRKNMSVLKRALSCGPVVLEDYEKPLGEMTEFPFVQFICTKVRDEIMSIITPLKDLQREVNKRRSQMLHILNSQAKSGYWMEQGSTDRGKLERDGAKNGFIGEYKTGSQPPTRIEPPPLATGVLALQNMSEDDIKQASGANTDLLGQVGEKKEPGIVLQLRQRQGQIVLEPIFDNFKSAHRVLGQRMIDVILKSGMYDVEEVMQILDLDQNTPEGMQKMQQTGQVVTSMFQDTNQKRFNVKTEVRPSSPTARMANLQELLDIQQSYPGVIPPEMMVEASDIKGKEKIIAYIMQQRQLQMAQAMTGAGAPPPPGGPGQ